MRLYKNTVDAVIQILREVCIDKRYADKVIKHVLKQNARWGARDRRFIAETAYEIIRNLRLVCECAGVTQINEQNLYELFGCWHILNKKELPQWSEFEKIYPQKILTNFSRLTAVFKIRESIPDWMDELGRQELADKWESECSAMNEQAAVVLRVNTLKTTRNELQKIVAENGIETASVNWAPEALVLNERQNVFKLPQFKDGLFEMQDAASQDVSLFLQIEPGMRVIDACAGAGGKTLHIASLLKNKGKVISLDVEQWKLDELMKRIKRAGATTVETRLIESGKIIKRLKGTADRLLLDVPCSGLGVLKRNPDAKWKLSMDFIESVKKTQQNILENYSSMLKPNGLMVYSTCSLLPSENEEQVNLFLNKNKGQYKLVEEKRHWPSEGFDGFYMALIKKTTDS